MRKGRAMEGVRQMIAYILRPEPFNPPINMVSAQRHYQGDHNCTLQ